MKMKAFRLDERTVAEMEEIRDHKRFPTQSDFVRSAIRRLIREERHRRIRAQIQREMRAEPSAEGQEVADPLIEDWFKRLERADRGEL